MTPFTPLMQRTALAKGVGLIVGISGFAITRLLLPEADSMLAWGVLALYVTIGGLIGLIGVTNRIPLLDLPLPPLLRGAAMGGWMTLLAVLFGYEMIREGMANGGPIPFGLRSPWWMLIDGIVLGGALDVIISRTVRGVPELYVPS